MDGTDAVVREAEERDAMNSVIELVGFGMMDIDDQAEVGELDRVVGERSVRDIFVSSDQIVGSQKGPPTSDNRCPNDLIVSQREIQEFSNGMKVGSCDG